MNSNYFFNQFIIHNLFYSIIATILLSSLKLVGAASDLFTANLSPSEFKLAKSCFFNCRDHYIMNDVRKCFDQTVRNKIKTYENIRKIVAGQGDDYAAGCLLDFLSFK